MAVDSKVFLEKFERGIQLVLMDKWFQVVCGSEHDIAMRAEVVSIVVKALGQTLEEIHYPSTWWQAFKQHFFPRWLLRWFPVEYTGHKIVTFYPKIALPDEPHWVTII